MPLLKKSTKGHLSQHKNGFKVPLIANHKHKIRDIIDNNLNKLETEKAHLAFVKSVAQEKCKDSSSLKEKNKQIDGDKEKTRKKVIRKKIDYGSPSENSTTDSVLSLSFDVDSSYSQEELNRDEIKNAYVEFMNNSLTNEKHKQKKRAIIYTSSEELLDNIVETFGDADQKEKVPPKKNKIKTKGKEQRKKSITSDNELIDLGDAERTDKICEKYEDNSSHKKIHRQLDGNKENLNKKVKKAPKKKTGKKNDSRRLSFNTEGSVSQVELNKDEIKTAYVEFMNNSLTDKENKKNNAIIYSSSEELFDDIVETLRKVDLKNKVIQKNKKETAKKKSDKKKRRIEQTQTSTSDDEFIGLTDQEKMEKINEKRNVGLYVLCDKCNKARYLPHVVDPLELPDKWFCHMNPDNEFNECSVPEHVDEDREFLIDNLYNAGSVVFAKLDGYPWWPAMVEDDVDTETYFWLQGNSMSPTFYHVTFFDSTEVTRAWIKTERVVPFLKNMEKREFQLLGRDRYKSRMNVAVKQALEATNMPLIDRLKTYGFLKRFKKPVNRNRNGKGKENRNKRRRELSPLVEDDLSKILDTVDMSDLSFNFLD